MHTGPTLQQESPGAQPRWYQGWTRYQLWVLVVGSLAWLLDTADQRFFVLARSPALAELMDKPQRDLAVNTFANYATAAMMIGWAVGGFYFGIVGDKWGRAKTLATSILVYSIFTGFSGFSTSQWDFCLYRFLMGCGIGGAFATAATLIAETVPSHARALSLGIFQALSALGNVSASFVGWKLIHADDRYFHGTFDGGLGGWRMLFFMGALPAVLVVLIMRTIKEPEAWLAARASSDEKLKKQMGDIRGMFRHPRWRRNTMVGVGLAVAGVVGLWGAGFWSPELINDALTPPEYRGTAEKLPQEIQTHIGQVKSFGTMIQDVGAFFGIFAFTLLATRLGRKITFGLSFVVAFVVVSAVFLTLRSEWQVWFMTPILGFVTLSVFGGYSIYFPEIYPTRLRSTGTAFCYNVARVLSAAIMILGTPLKSFLTGIGVGNAFRWGTVAMCSFYLLGVVVLIWAPETKGQPLPEDEPATA